MFTGLLPRAARLAAPVTEGVDVREAMEGLENRVLPAVLRHHGYRTAAVSANVWISEPHGFATGFDEFVTIDTGRQANLHRTGMRPELRWAVEGTRSRVDDGAAASARVLDRWIGAADQRSPWFWFVNLVECHSPYLPPRPYNDLGALGRWRAAKEARRHLTLGAIWRTCLGEFDVSDAALARMRYLYSRSIRYMDDWLGQLLDRLDARGLLEQTLVLIVSDHGENFGEGGLLTHAFSLDDRLTRVPLVVSGPGAEAFENRLTSLAELPRLIARAVGLGQHPWEEPLPAGAAVAQFNAPARPDDPRTKEAREEWGLDDAAFHRLTTPFVSATDGHLKLVRETGEERLYDLRTDPLELAPQAPGNLDGDPVLATLRAALDHPATNATVPPGRYGMVARTERVPADPDEAAEIEERMKLLGYM
jgi:arylsulfatase A-like enzyme